MKAVISLDAPTAAVSPDLQPAAPSRGYLEMLDLFRVIACVAVVANHSFIWANMSTNVIGTGIVTMLHLSRNAFFFLSGLVICYSQLAHRRSRQVFWKRRFVQLGIPYLAWTGIYSSSPSSMSARPGTKCGRFWKVTFRWDIHSSIRRS
jgi:uncharacterized membrane protein